eukprot:217121-Amphidinium_carterae.4
MLNIGVGNRLSDGQNLASIKLGELHKALGPEFERANSSRGQGVRHYVLLASEVLKANYNYSWAPNADQEGTEHNQPAKRSASSRHSAASPLPTSAASLAQHKVLFHPTHPPKGSSGMAFSYVFFPLRRLLYFEGEMHNLCSNPFSIDWGVLARGNFTSRKQLFFC